MWPTLLEMTKEESMQNLRKLELEAYAHLVSALRAQGPLDSVKRRLLKDTSNVLNISHERYRAEIRRAVNDEHLNTIAYHVTGGLMNNQEDWALEGRRTVPLMQRIPPQTVYSAVADEAAEKNRHLPSPAVTTVRHTSSTAPVTVTIPSTPTTIHTVYPSDVRTTTVPLRAATDEVRKRKLSGLCPETSSLAQHLLSTSTNMATRSCRPQLYKTKPVLTKKPPPKDMTEMIKRHTAYSLKLNGPTTTTKLTETTSETIEQIQNEINSYITPNPASLTTPTRAATMKAVQIPVVKNLQLKNLEKFKIVTSPLVANGSTTTSTAKLLTVNNPVMKKVIPLSQWLTTNKGTGIKVVPFTKIPPPPPPSSSISSTKCNATSSPLLVTVTTTLTPPTSDSQPTIVTTNDDSEMTLLNHNSLNTNTPSEDTTTSDKNVENNNNDNSNSSSGDGDEISTLLVEEQGDDGDESSTLNWLNANNSNSITGDEMDLPMVSENQ